MEREHRRKEYAPLVNFEILDIRAIVNAARFNVMEYRIDPVERCVSFEGAKHMNMSTLFGGNRNDPVIIKEDGVKKLQHDLVHCCLSDVPEGGVKLMGMTPDILFPAGDGRYDILEITTSESPGQSAVDNAFESKLRKYTQLVHPQPAVGRSLNILVVTRDGCYDLRGKLDETDGVKSLIRAFNQGSNIQREYSESPGFLQFEKFTSEDQRSLRDLVGSVSMKDDPLMPSSLFSKAVPRHPEGMILCNAGIETKGMSFEDYEARMRNKEEQKEASYRPSCIHVPMLIVNKTCDETVQADAAEGLDFYSQVFNECLLKGLHHGRSFDFDTLRAMSEIGSEDQKSKKPPKDAPDMIWMKMTDVMKIEIGRRGVLKKKEKLWSEPEIQEKDKLDSMDINFDEDLSCIEDFITSDINKGEPVDLFQELEHCFDEEVLMRVGGVFNDCYSIWEMQALSFLDKALREIDYNLTRFPNDNMRGRQFYFRMIPGYEAFVLFRTASAGAPSGDPSHIFYSIFFKGLSPWEVFERVIDLGNGWHHTEFLSTDQERLSQKIGIQHQVMAQWAYLVDESGDPETSSSDGLSPFTDFDSMSRMIAPLRHVIMILVEDKQVTSLALQDFRYYYMKLNTGLRSSKSWAETVSEKFPEMIRSRLLLYYLKSLMSIHRSIPDNITRIERVEESEEYVSEEEEEDTGILDPDQAAFVIKMGLMTPFSFRINTPSDLVKAMYMGYMHNKNEGFSGHGGIKMMEKTLSQAIKFKNLNLKDSEEESYCCVDTVDPNAIKDFQHSSVALKHSCTLVKKRLCERAGISLEDYPNYIEGEILRYMLRDTLSDLATTRSSTIPLGVTHIESSDSNEFKTFAQRRKCIEAILANWETYNHRICSLNLDSVIQAIEDSEGGCIQVSMEKKKQIGGTRETYILTINGRMAIKYFCDPFRAICQLHPWEVLTKPENKQTFIPDHYEKSRNLPGRYRATLKVSADCKLWAQGFSQFEFAEMSRDLLPSSFHPLCQRVLLMHRRKITCLPKSVVKQFIDHPTSHLSSDSVNAVKREFLGLDRPFILSGDHEATFKNHIDMMQGILHYPSSMLHICSCEYQAEIFRLWSAPRGLGCLVTSVASSDDEGTLVTISCDDKDQLKKESGRLINVTPRVMNSSTRLHGMRVSWVKTSFTLLDIIEVNSEFHFGNTLQRALSKFINNCIHIEPGESLHLQISTLYSKLRELRSNGASGALCHFASVAQCLAFTDNLGVGVMSWYQPGLYNKLTETRTTSSGFYMILNELKAGLVDSTYVNWVACLRSVDSRKVVYFLNNYALPLTPEEHVTCKFSIAPTTKYKSMLRRLSLTGRSQSEMDETLFRVVVVGPEDLDEEKQSIEHTILTPSISKSMRHLNRTHAARMAPYVMWSAMYKDDDHDMTRLSLPTLIRKCIEKEVDDSLISVKNLFPMSDQFKLIQEMDRVEYTLSHVKGFRRLFHCFVSPQYYGSDHMSHLKEVLIFKWYGKRGILSTRMSESYFVALKETMPWIKETLRETQESMPMKDLNELAAFINSSTQTRTSFSALVRGRPKKSFSSVQALARGNTFSRRILEPTTGLREALDISSNLHTTLYSQKLGDRLSAWKELLSSSEEEEKICRDELLEMFTHDMTVISNDLPPLMGLIKTGNPNDDIVSLYVRLMTRTLDTRGFFSEVKTAKLFRTIQKKENGIWSGNTTYYQKSKGVLSLITVTDSTTYVEADCSEEKFKKCFSWSPDSFRQNPRIRVPSCTYTKCDWVKGSLMMVMTDGREEWYMDFPRTHAREVHLKVQSSNLPQSLELWLTREAGNSDTFSMEKVSVLGINIESVIARCIMRACRKLDKSVKIRQLKERIPDDPPDPDPDLESSFVMPTSIMGIIDLYAEEFEPVEDVTERFDDAFPDFIMDLESPAEVRAMGMEATNLESFMSNLEHNRTLSSMRKILSSMMTIRSMLGHTYKELLDWYTSLNTKSFS